MIAQPPTLSISSACGVPFRSHPISPYALRHVDKRAYLLDGVAGMLAEQSTMLTSKDLLIAIGFQPSPAKPWRSSAPRAERRRRSSPSPTAA